MAITSNPALKENAAPAPAPSAAPSAAPKAAAPTAKAGAPAGKSSAKSEAFRNAGKELIANMSEDQKAAMGSKSNTLAFVAALGDPRQRQDRVSGNATVTSYLVVGFRFKAVEPVTFMRKPFNAQPKDILDVDYACTETVTVQAGETFDLNLVETARLLAQPVYGGSATGSEKGVFLTYKESQTRKDPLPVLSCIGKGSVKEGMILISDKVGENEWKVKPEFQPIFQPLYTKKNAVKKGSANSKDQNSTRHEVAASFLAFLMKKEQEAGATAGQPQA